MQNQLVNILKKMEFFLNDLLTADSICGFDEVKIENTINQIDADLVTLIKTEHDIGNLKSLLSNDLLPLNVGIVGDFSTGKSSIINSMIGKDLLFSDVKPATSKISVLKYGDSEKIQVTYMDGSSKALSFSQFKEMANHSSNKKEKLGSEIKNFEVYYPAEFLRHINLIDTPGFSTISETDDTLTKEWLKKMDILLWAFDINRGAVQQNELKLISDTARELGSNKITAIVNKSDSVPPSERGKLLKEFNEGYDFNEIILYSAKKVLKQKTAKQENLNIVQSTLQQIDSEQFVEIHNDKVIIKGKDKDEKILLKNHSDRLSDESLKQIDEYFSDLRSRKRDFSRVELERRLDVHQIHFKRILTNQEKTLTELKKIIHNEKTLIKNKSEHHLKLIKLFNSQFLDNRKKSYEVNKSVLINKLNDAMKQKVSHKKLYEIMYNLLETYCFRSDLHSIESFINLNEITFDFSKDLDILTDFKIELFEVSKLRFLQIEKEKFWDIDSEVLEVVLPYKQYHNIVTKFYERVLNRLSKEVSERCIRNTEELDKKIEELESIHSIIDKQIIV